MAGEIQSNLVVVAVDSGPFSESAFKKALRVFALDKTIFHLLHVRPAEESVLDSFSAAVREYHDRAEQKRREESQKVLSKFRELAEAGGAQHQEVELKCEAQFYAPQGDPREELCRYCRDIKADVLVLGTRGQGPAGRLLMGSVSTYCMSHAPCTVMIDHDKEAEDKTAMQQLIEAQGTRHG